MTYIVMAYAAIADMVIAYTVIADIAMACIVLAYSCGTVLYISM